MNHETLKEKVFAFYDNELPPGERAAVEAHLLSCPECRALHEDWARTAAALSHGVTPSPAGFTNRVMARIDNLPQPAGLPWWVPAVSLALAAASYFLTPRPDAVSTENLLTANGLETAAEQWVSYDETTRPDNVLEVNLEET